MKNVYQPLFDDNNPPSEIFFGHTIFLPNTGTEKHRHPWGQLQLISGGIIELAAENKHFLAPPQYALWVPPEIEHQSYIRRSLNYCSMNITKPLANALPNYACLLEVSPLMQAMVQDLRERRIVIPETPQDKRLVKVLFDQVLMSKEHEQYLPTTDDKLLQSMLIELEKNPTNNRSLAQWAKQLHTTERTLARHFKDKLGMSFTEWRQRRKFIYSLHLLRSGLSVKEIALTLGYHQASPFITAFKKQSGSTPDQYRQRLGDEAMPPKL
ncbi:AraC family transcriptional regulator [Photobacterium leiognathi]|uniref:AraC family transcriptional regulator n=1 Tax=Photobacterium leiognathi TaxID=553611 RepID=UPI00273278C8|nr:helix-turn-helix transcriptional regulator [Photobacterium leiognathi]